MTHRARGLKLLGHLLGDTPHNSQWSWATVTATGPLRIKLDGESTALAITPDTLVSGLAVNNRVWVQLVTNDDPARRHHRAVVIGKAV